jgi:hypothetical protein
VKISTPKINVSQSSKAEWSTARRLTNITLDGKPMGEEWGGREVFHKPAAERTGTSNKLQEGHKAPVTFPVGEGWTLEALESELKTRFADNHLDEAVLQDFDGRLHVIYADRFPSEVKEGTTLGSDTRANSGYSHEPVTGTLRGTIVAVHRELDWDKVKAHFTNPSLLFAAGLSVIPAATVAGAKLAGADGAITGFMVSSLTAGPASVLMGLNSFSSDGVYGYLPRADPDALLKLSGPAPKHVPLPSLSLGDDEKKK